MNQFISVQSYHVSDDWYKIHRVVEHTSRQTLAADMGVLLFVLFMVMSHHVLGTMNQLERKIFPFIRNMNFIRIFQPILRNYKAGKPIGEKKLGVAKLLNHLKNHLKTIPFNFKYMTFKPDLL